MSAATGIMILMGIIFVITGLALLLGTIPAKWKARIKLTRHGAFLLKLIGITLIIFGLESILNILAPRMGWAWPDTNGIIGISVMTLCLLTLGLGWLSGTFQFSNDDGSSSSSSSSKALRWLGIGFVLYGLGFFMVTMGIKMSLDSIESIGMLMQLGALLSLIVAAMRMREQSPGSSQDE